MMLGICMHLYICIFLQIFLILEEGFSYFPDITGTENYMLVAHLKCKHILRFWE